MDRKVIFFEIICLVILLCIMFNSINNQDNLEKVIKAAGIEIEENQLWVEVILNDKEHKVIIWKGDKIQKEMPCSGGTEEEPTIMGVFFLENRGEWFYSERFKQGALYWVRFYKQYLFHSVPLDEDFNEIQEEKELIGKAASHGCIRLLKEDAEWFYYNIPDNTLVVIHD